MSNKTSSIFSLADTFSYCPKQLNTFIELGHAALGAYHVVIFNKGGAEGQLFSIDYKNSIKLNKFCCAYSIVNARGSLHGTLFSVKYDKLKLFPKKFTVNSIDEPTFDFSLYPYSNEKSNVLFYKDSVGTVLVVSTFFDDSSLLVLDEKNG